MAKSKQVKASKRQEIVQQPTPPAQDEEMEDESDVEIVVDGEMEKDETEEELERLVFGDSAGFREGLKDFDAEEVEEQEEDGTGLEGLDDAQLFFTDTGDNTLAPPPETASDGESEDGTLRSKQPPAWEDSDDERTLVSLASVPRLRKLRRTEAEDVVTGKEYGRRLRKQFELLNPAPEWARTALHKPAKKKRRTSEAASDEEISDNEMDIDEDLPSTAPLSQLLQDAESLVRQAGPGAGKKRKIRPEVVDIQRQKDIPGIQPSAITSLSFHPNLPLLLSSGPSSTLYLHQLAQSPPAPTPNPLLTSLHVRGSQLTTTAFHPTDSRIFLSARRRYFHIWNLSTGRVEKITRVYGQQHEQKSMEHFKLSPTGRYMALQGSTKKGGGIINILDASTLQWVSQVRIESRGGIADFAWWRDGRGLTVAGKGGEITEWDVAEQKVVARWQDEGAAGTTTLALGGHHEVTRGPIGTDRWIAVGSSSGIVNIYDRRAWLGNNPKSASGSDIPQQPKPTRTLDHITTPTSHLTFSHDGQVLAMASKWKRDAMRLVHLPSCTVFKNWPTSSTPLGRITGVAFAPGEAVSGSDAHSILAVANEQGKIRLWEVR
ncbi:putative U3 small nucleolar RNA-associated protein 18 [Pseudocercospora fuligena]|uniref:Putative U3 small nucleolar RNA-associated protein 18 n=1 Tax=Pseudocercospora fuligena TaxID=685502 RepID=A0A8H6VF07_9PEZI|nr:putative U3 small nucleolar RNA-associated protein 18 [Pseudocercospora fuligena]